MTNISVSFFFDSTVLCFHTRRRLAVKSEREFYMSKMPSAPSSAGPNYGSADRHVFFKKEDGSGCERTALRDR